MLANQKLKASDGKEVALFPFEYLYMSQDEGGDFSHANTYNIDFLGWDKNGRVYNGEYYAPCTLICVNDTFDVSANDRVFQSTDLVHLANGDIDYLTITFAHDNSPLYHLGDVINQGDILGHTGTSGNVTGDHIHSCCGEGQYQGYVQRLGGNWDLRNRIHYWEACYINDTIIVNGFNHPWKTWEDGIIPGITKGKNKFPWVLYANKLRDVNNN